MPIAAPCTHCGRRYNLGDKYAGQRVTCTECGQHFHVPAARSGPADALTRLMEAERAAPPLSSSGGSPLTRPGGSGGKWPTGAINLKRKGQGTDPSLMPYGISLAVLGLGGFLLPLVGPGWKVLNPLGVFQPWVAGILAASGALVMFIACEDNRRLGVRSAGGVLGALAILVFIEIVNTGSPAYREARALTVEMLTGLHKYASIYERVNDQASYVQAQSQIMDLQPRTVDLVKRLGAVGRQLTWEESQAVQSEFRAPLEAASNRIREETQRIAQFNMPQRPGETLSLLGALFRAFIPGGNRPPAEMPGGNEPPADMPGISGSPANMPGVHGPPGGFPGMPGGSNGPPGGAGQNPAEDMRQSLLAQYGAHRVVTVTVSNVPPGAEQWVYDQLREANRAVGFVASSKNGLIIASFGPVGDVQAVAALIEWGTVTSVDAIARTITIAADPARLPPQ